MSTQRLSALRQYRDSLSCVNTETEARYPASNQRHSACVNPETIHTILSQRQFALHQPKDHLPCVNPGAHYHTTTQCNSRCFKINQMPQWYCMCVEGASVPLYYCPTIDTALYCLIGLLPKQHIALEILRCWYLYRMIVGLRLVVEILWISCIYLGEAEVRYHASTQLCGLLHKIWMNGVNLNHCLAFPKSSRTPEISCRWHWLDCFLWSYVPF